MIFRLFMNKDATNVSVSQVNYQEGFQSLNKIAWKNFPSDIFLCAEKTLGIMNLRCDRMSLSKARCRKEGSQAGAPFFYVLN